ncbi:MAG: CHAD domain-containing protein [Alphaproteobacteria bacterium]|nr:CHAD domain-containing protein [Alphaproteobacteria bacterium]
MNGKRTDRAYRFKADDMSAEAAIRRVALSQIDAAIAEIDRGALSQKDIVHDVRKRCKKVRALVGLVKTEFADYANENAAFRELAGTLAGVRDCDVLIETCDLVSAHCRREEDRMAVAAIRAQLMRDRHIVADDGALPEKLAHFRHACVKARDRVQDWRVPGKGFDAFAKGLRSTLKRGRKAMAAARKDPCADTMHEWRKQVKYHWYHARLLRGIWTGPMEAHIEAANVLGERLGDHHDLAVLRQTLKERPDHYGDRDAVRHVMKLVANRERDITKTIFHQGALLYAERPEALVSRWSAYWTLWRGEG